MSKESELTFNGITKINPFKKLKLDSDSLILAI